LIREELQEERRQVERNCYWNFQIFKSFEVSERHRRNADNCKVSS